MLSILILTIEERRDYLDPLLSKIINQVHALSRKEGVDYQNQIQILKDPRGKGYTKGTKRNDLLKTASGDYVCFIDDDDDIADDYLEVLIEALRYEPDCVSLRGVMTTNGENPEVFEHSLKYTAWNDNGAAYPVARYERYPNHLNAIRANIAKQFKFPEIDYGEDHRWSTAIHESGLLKKEYYIDKVLYYYKYVTKK